MPRMVDLGVTTILWLPGESPIADIAAPTVTELTAPEAVNITVWTKATTVLRAAGSETVSERSIAETSNVVTPTIQNYEGTLELFRDFTAGAPTEDDLMEMFSGSPVGMIARRVGKPNADPIAAGDYFDFIGKFRPDTPQSNPGAGEGLLSMTVPLFPQGLFTTNATVASGV